MDWRISGFMDALVKVHKAGHGLAIHPTIHHSITPSLRHSIIPSIEQSTPFPGNLPPPFLKELVNRS
jgi:hypothetical protein